VEGVLVATVSPKVLSKPFGAEACSLVALALRYEYFMLSIVIMVEFKGEGRSLRPS
jgi:hypothetical protein